MVLDVDLVVDLGSCLAYFSGSIDGRPFLLKVLTFQPPGFHSCIELHFSSISEAFKSIIHQKWIDDNSNNNNSSSKMSLIPSLFIQK